MAPGKFFDQYTIYSLIFANGFDNAARRDIKAHFSHTGKIGKLSMKRYMGLHTGPSLLVAKEFANQEGFGLSFPI